MTWQEYVMDNQITNDYYDNELSRLTRRDEEEDNRLEEVNNEDSI